MNYAKVLAVEKVTSFVNSVIQFCDGYVSFPYCDSSGEMSITSDDQLKRLIEDDNLQVNLDGYYSVSELELIVSAVKTIQAMEVNYE